MIASKSSQKMGVNSHYRKKKKFGDFFGEVINIFRGPPNWQESFRTLTLSLILCHNMVLRLVGSENARFRHVLFSANYLLFGNFLHVRV